MIIITTFIHVTPQGLKKPYNPIIGETFRCYWDHPTTSSRTFYIAEQISHHPPITGVCVTNRKDGFNISGSILAKSKFYGMTLYRNSIENNCVHALDYIYLYYTKLNRCIASECTHYTASFEI